MCVMYVCVVCMYLHQIRSGDGLADGKFCRSGWQEALEGGLEAHEGGLERLEVGLGAQEGGHEDGADMPHPQDIRTTPLRGTQALRPDLCEI